MTFPKVMSTSTSAPPAALAPSSTNSLSKSLDSFSFWNRIHEMRTAASTRSTTFGMVEIDLSDIDSASVRGQVIERIEQFAAANWIHDLQRGWLSARSYGILLPQASVAEAITFGEQLASHAIIPKKHVTIVDADPASRARREGEIRIVPIFERAVRPSPAWKRCVDILAGLGFLLAVSPVLLLAILAIRLTSPGPVMFRQQRIGLGGRKFWMYKLRTMVNGSEELRADLSVYNEQSGLAFKMLHDPRVTTVGRFLRQSSLDELPQLWNVLRGDMSLVGPRPLPASDWHPEEAWHCVRHDVRPGLTCTWQVSGRIEVPFEEWMRMDLDYVRDLSLWNDLRIILRTLPAILTRRGAC